MEESIVVVKFIPLGGEKVFIKIDKDGKILELVKDSNKLFNKWFNIVREWEICHMDMIRYIWCCIYEVPFHA